jgi:hypothetical protein
MKGGKRNVPWLGELLHLAGTAAATLTGLLFVVITLGTRLSTPHAVLGVNAFLTPTLVHFVGVLLQAMAVLVPWPSAWPIGIILCLFGLVGLAYEMVIIRKLRKLDFVSLHRLDWIPYAGLPILGDLSLIAGAAGLIAAASFAPYAIGGAITLFLFVSIYGSWDLTLWLVRNRNVT